MAVYAIGDVQGCYQSLQQLLQGLHFNPEKDQLWFVGDLVNRGPDSLKTLQFVKSLGKSAVTVLGNHDLHLLAVYHGMAECKSRDTLDQILSSPDVDNLMQWLRYQPLFYHDLDLNFAMVHAGVFPGWSVSDTLQYSSEVETWLQGDQHIDFFACMYGDMPDAWDESLAGMDRARFITNVLTRMRYLTPKKRLDLRAKGKPDHNPERIPWFEFKQKAIKHNRLVFGHWSTLPSDQYGQCFALDSGCLWGGRLTALRIDKKIPRWYQIKC